MEVAGHPGRKVKRPFCNDICQYRYLVHSHNGTSVSAGNSVFQRFFPLQDFHDGEAKSYDDKALCRTLPSEVLGN